MRNVVEGLHKWFESRTALDEALGESPHENTLLLKEAILEIVRLREQLSSLQDTHAIVVQQRDEAVRKYKETTGGFKRDLQSKLDQQRERNKLLVEKLAACEKDRNGISAYSEELIHHNKRLMDSLCEAETTLAACERRLTDAVVAGLPRQNYEGTIEKLKEEYAQRTKQWMHELDRADELQREVNELQETLAASEAIEYQLRGALGTYKTEGSIMFQSYDYYKVAKALSIESNKSALEAELAEEREHCARIAETTPIQTYACEPYILQVRVARETIAAAIRKLNDNLCNRGTLDR